jgi:hypothetical protein
MPQKITINSHSGGKFKEVVLNNRAHIITEMMSIEGDSTMNNLFYPDDQVTNSFKQLDMKPAPAGHPTANGENISAFHPLAINAFNVGGFIRNSRKEGKKVFNELVFDIEVANKDDRGKEIIKRIKSGEKIGVSTGLNATVTSSGDKKVVSDIEFDHVAVLLDESPAGDNTFTVNSDIILCKMGDEPEIKPTEEVNDMDREKLVLAAIGNSANSLKGEDKERLMSMSESEIVSAIVNNAIVDAETATKVVEDMGMTVNSKQDSEGYKTFVSNKESFDAYMADKEAARNDKIDTIVNAEGSEVAKEDLVNASEAFLDKLASIIKPKSDYSAQGQPLTNSDRGVEVENIELHEDA